MLSRIGIHELKAVDDGVLRALAPQTMVLAFAPFSSVEAHQLDNVAKATVHVLNRKALLPQTRIAVRWWPDDHRSMNMTARQAADMLFPLSVPGTLLMPDNEAASEKGSPATFVKVTEFWASLVRLATDARIPLAIGCTPTGTPDYDQYRLYASVLKAMRDGARKGVVHWLYTNAYWDPEDTGYREHHLDRPAREIAKVATASKVPMPPLMLGETGIAWQYQPLRGFRERMGAETFARRMVEEARRMSHPVNVFCAGSDIHNGDRWRLFNVDDPEYWAYVTEHAPRVEPNANERLEEQYMDDSRASASSGTTVPAVGKPTTAARTGVVTKLTGAFVNIRSAPSPKAQDLGDLKLGDRVTFYPDARQEGYVYVETAKASGWAYEQGGQLLIAADQPDVPPAPPAPVEPTPVPPAPPAVVPLPSDNPALRTNILTMFKEIEVNAAQAAANQLAIASAAAALRQSFATLWNISLGETS